MPDSFPTFREFFGTKNVHACLRFQVNTMDNGCYALIVFDFVKRSIRLIGSYGVYNPLIVFPGFLFEKTADLWVAE